MSWNYKVSVNQLILFCEDWKTSNEIRDEFDLTNSEIWRCIRYCRSLYNDFEYKSCIGETKRMYALKARQRALEEVKNGTQRT